VLQVTANSSITDAIINRCKNKFFFGYNRSDSMSGVLMLFKLPSADTIVHNSRRLFIQQCVMSCSSIVQWFEAIDV